MERKKYCVYGEWRESKTNKWLPVTDSSTGELIAEVPCCTQDELKEAIDSAAAAFPSWSLTAISKRTQYLFKWRNILVDHLDELTYLCAKELGKNLNEARGDVLKAIEPTELACSAPFITQGSASLQVTTGFDTATYRMPLGVVAGIVPFNFPAMIPWGWMVPLAIATGNTVVLKAASFTPLTAMRIMELFYEEGGFPKGVVNLVTCSRSESELLLTDPRVKAVTFVGTTEVGNAPFETFMASDKPVIIAAHRDMLFKRFCQVTDRMDLLEDPRFASPSLRVTNRDALAEIIQQIIGQHTADYWVEKLEAGEVPVGIVNNIKDICESEQVKARDMIVEVYNPNIGYFKQMGTPYKMSETPASAMSYTEETGESNYAVFSGILGMSDEEITALLEKQKKKKEN